MSFEFLDYEKASRREPAAGGRPRPRGPGRSRGRREVKKAELKLDASAVSAFLGCDHVLDAGWHPDYQTIAVRCRRPGQNFPAWRYLPYCWENCRSALPNVSFTEDDVRLLFGAEERKKGIPPGTRYFRCRRLNRLIAEIYCNKLSFCAGCIGPLGEE